MSLKSFTLFDELSLKGSLRKSVQGECCAASLLAGITEPQTQRVNSEAPLSLPPAAAYKASLKLGISDSIVEVSLKGTIRLKEAELPRLMGVGEHLATRGKIHLVKRSSCFAEEFTL